MDEREDARAVVERARSDGVLLLSLQFTDIVGSIKSVTIPLRHLENALEQGVWFDGSSVEGFSRICESDMLLKPDPTTYRVMSWLPAERRIARIICDLCRPDGEPFEGDPRYVLRQQVERARRMGFIYNTGSELEFFLFKTENGPAPKPIPFDVGGYFDSSQGDEAAMVRREMMFALEAMGMDVEMAHHEVAAGQHEINIRFADALTSADNNITLKYTVKAVAQRHGVYATFMPKPIFGVNGSGMHTHQSLSDLEGRNLFYASDDPYHLSPLAYHFIAGQLAHARALAAVIAPTVNSYKRLVPGYEAPVYICWGQINRSALIRIPRCSPGQEEKTRAEFRAPDPSCNPYLALAVMLAAGLDGIDRKLDPPAPIEENVYEFTPEELQEYDVETLPSDLREALEALRQDPVVLGALGTHIGPWFLRAKEREWREYSIQVTEWELERYLGVL